MNGKRVVGLGPKLIEILERIREQKEKEGFDNVSYCQAGEILARRIINAGGLKE